MCRKKKVKKKAFKGTERARVSKKRNNNNNNKNINNKKKLNIKK